MDFTREPIIETVVTPKEGCKLVVRSSKSSGQEEYFVDAVEVVSFGSTFFFRSQERPKSFLVPANDYEILEVREARMVLKNVGLDKSIKIGGGKEPVQKGLKEPVQEKSEPAVVSSDEVPSGDASESRPEVRMDKKRERRRHYRRRRGRDEVQDKETLSESEAVENMPESLETKIELPEPRQIERGEPSLAEPLTTSAMILSSILPPPPMLISESIARYKDNAMFKGAFFMRENKANEEAGDESSEGEDIQIDIEEPKLGSFGTSEEEDEEIFLHRTTSFLVDEEPALEEPEEGKSSQSAETKGHISNGNHSV